MRTTALVCVLASSSLLAQTPATISPTLAATSLGNANNNIPFSWRPCSYQQVCSAQSFSVPGPMQFGMMRMRIANGFTNRAGNTIDVEMFIADSQNDSAAASSVFAANVIPGTQVNAFNRKILNLPTLPNNNWSIMIPFDNAFVWQGGHLSWHVDIYGNGNSNQFFTYPIDAFSGRGRSVRTGSFNGCQHPAATKVAYHSVSIASPGSLSTWTGRSFVATGGMPALLMIGGSDQVLSNGIPLPLDLSIIGAPGCLMVQDALAISAGVTAANPNGQVDIRLPIPPDPTLQGVVLHSQYAFLDAAANQLGLFVSNGRTSTIGTDPLTVRIYNTSGPGMTSGSVSRQFGLSVAFN